MRLLLIITQANVQTVTIPKLFLGPPSTIRSPQVTAVQTITVLLAIQGVIPQVGLAPIAIRSKKWMKNMTMKTATRVVTVHNAIQTAVNMTIKPSK